MSLQLGRIVGLPEPRDWSAQGDTVTLKGYYQAASVADGLQRRDQLLGFGSNIDEPVIPVIIDGEPRLSGFYAPSRPHVDTDPAVLRAGNLIDFTIDLERIDSFAQPQFENVWSGGLMANDHGITSAGQAFPWAAITRSADEYAADFGFQQQAPESADDTNGLWTMHDLTSGTPHFTGSLRWGITPARFYWSSALLEAGTALLPIVGRRLPKSDWSNWRLSNGIVRITPSATVANLMLSWYTSAAWSTQKEFGLHIGSPPPSQRITSITSFTILRNDPACVIIRLGINWSLTPPTASYVDIILRRGAMGIDLVFQTPAIFTIAPSVGRIVAEAATAVTGGMYATTPDGTGTSYFLASARTATKDLVNGYLSDTNFLNVWDCHIGYCRPAGSSLQTPQNRVYGYLGPVSETQRVVAR